MNNVLLFRVLEMGYRGRADFYPTGGGGINTLAPVTSSTAQTTRNYIKKCWEKYGQPKTRDVRQRSKNNVGAAKTFTTLKTRGNYFIHKMSTYNKCFRNFSENRLFRFSCMSEHHFTSNFCFWKIDKFFATTWNATTFYQLLESYHLATLLSWHLLSGC